MSHETVFVTLHIHTDGPIPGPHSLLTLSSAAFAGEDGRLISTFSTNVRELPGATLHPESFEHWRTRADDWLTTRRASRPPALATDAYLQWISRLPGEPTLIADPVGPDHLFLYWYLHRFGGRWPFAGTSTDADLRRLLPRPLCSLSGCRTTLAHSS